MSIQGLIGKKIGTTQVFRESGEAVSVTALRAGPCTVTQVKGVEKDGYESVQVGYEEVRRLNKPRGGHLGPAGKLFRYLREFRASDISEIEVGQEIGVDLFEPGDRVDAIGLSKGRGFAGGVKRHGFHGGPKTHGAVRPTQSTGFNRRGQLSWKGHQRAAYGWAYGQCTCHGQKPGSGLG